MIMIIKICGIQTTEDAHAAIQAGAHWLGFVFANSKRKISPTRARTIIKSINKSVQTVGVFVNERVETINEIVHDVGLNIVQLHGDETPDIISQIRVPTIKAFPIDQLKNIELANYPSDYFLIDSQRTTYYGGSGQTFDWTLLQNERTTLKDKLIVAGGLNPTNVQQAIRTLQPSGVDVSSGVETRGIKDIKKMTCFVNQITQMKGVRKHDEL